MKNISVNTIPKSDLNVSTLDIGMVDYDPHDGILLMVTFLNANRNIIDRQQIELTGDPYQQWPEAESKEDDDKYIKQFVLTSLGIEEDKK